MVEIVSTPDYPAYTGAPDANAIPRQSGMATKKTDKPADKSYFNQVRR